MRTNLTLFLVAASMAACGGTPAEDPTKAVDDFIDKLATTQCSWEFRCCKDAQQVLRDGTRYHDQTQCHAWQVVALKNEKYTERLAVAEGRVRVDAVKAASCEQLLTDRACDPDPNKPPMPVDPKMYDDCLHVFVGATPVGAECVYAIECVQGSHCYFDPQAPGRGVCEPYQQLTEPCINAGSFGSGDCDPSVDLLYCAAQDYSCHVRAKLGEACAYTLDTTGPTLPLLLECDNTAEAKLYCSSTSMTCKKLPGAGEPCVSPLPPGQFTACDPDPLLRLSCLNGTCRAPGKLGEDCTTIACSAELYCNFNAGNVCANLPGLNMSCRDSNFVCAKPYFCNFNKGEICDQPAMLGDDCTNTTCSTGLYCDQNANPNPACAKQLPDNAKCTSSQQCLSFDCNGPFGNQICRPHVVVQQACIGR